MTFSFGGSSSSKKSSGTQQLVMPAATAGETELKAVNLQTAKMQAAQMAKEMSDQAAYEASPQGVMEKRIQAKANQNILARLEGTAPVLTPEEQARLDQIYGSATAEGTQNLQQAAFERAQAQGMTVMDTPVGSEYLRQQRLFQERMSAQKSASALDLGNAQAAFNASLAQHQAELRQQSFNNRLMLAGQAPASYGYGNTLFSQRAAGSPLFQSGNVSGSASNWGTGMSLSGTGGGTLKGLSFGGTS